MHGIFSQLSENRKGRLDILLNGTGKPEIRSDGLEIDKIETIAL